MNHIPFKNYNQANEILYILNSIKNEGVVSISKIGIQKVIYLANLFSPIKNIILATIKFLSYKRGPYSSEIQNTLDQLISNGYVDVVSFKSFNNQASIASYSINNAGEIVVSKLIKYEKEQNKEWWYDCIVKLSNIYSKQETLTQSANYTGFDTIVNLVYQDDTYLNIKNNHDFDRFINTADENSPTFQLIKYVKNYIEENNLYLSNSNIKRNTELILISFFEFLYSKYIDSLEYE